MTRGARAIRRKPIGTDDRHPKSDAGGFRNSGTRPHLYRCVIPLTVRIELWQPRRYAGFGLAFGRKSFAFYAQVGCLSPRFSVTGRNAFYRTFPKTRIPLSSPRASHPKRGARFMPVRGRIAALRTTPRVPAFTWSTPTRALGSTFQPRAFSFARNAARGGSAEISTASRYTSSRAKCRPTSSRASNTSDPIVTPPG